MYQKLKAEIKEIIEIVNQCPEGLQEKCFELLLENFINSNVDTKIEKVQTKGNANNKCTNENMKVNNEEELFDKTDDEEISLKDFHIKIRKFLETNGIGIDVINSLYYKENNKLMPLYDSLCSTKMAECQIRLALLTAFENSFSNANGEMVFNGEVVRQRCQDMKCYDTTNFSSIFKKSSSLFDNWNEKYDKTAEYSLSLEAKKELAKIILDLAKGE